MLFFRVLILCAASCTTLLAWKVACAGESSYAGVGRVPTSEEIRIWDIGVGPSGKELPPGRGAPAQGEHIYAARCAACHGATGTEGPGARLVNNNPSRRYPGVAGWPYATTVWDYINRAMPIYGPPLSADEVYAVVAFLFFKNGLIGASDVMNRQTLPKLVMPTRDEFFPKADVLWWKPGEARKYGLYPLYP